MNYLLDTNALTGTALRDEAYRTQVFVIRDVADEFGTTKTKADQLSRSNVQIRELEAKHFEGLKHLMDTYGGNTKLMNLLTNEGKGDVLMLAYVVTERDRSESLFPETFTIVSEDKELIRVAKELGIATLPRLES